MITNSVVACVVKKPHVMVEKSWYSRNRRGRLAQMDYDTPDQEFRFVSEDMQSLTIYASTLISSARLTGPPVANIIFFSLQFVLFCENLKSDGPDVPTDGHV